MPWIVSMDNNLECIGLHCFDDYYKIVIKQVMLALKAYV